MKTTPDETNVISAVAAAREGYELAQACAWLAVVIAIAVLLSNFGPEPKAVAGAREQVAIHQTILREHEALLRQNEAVLRENQALL